jgi:stearoyl-CoA desaturase (Delta-9 desaturase)
MSRTTLENIHVKSMRNTSKLRLQGKEMIVSTTTTNSTPKTRQIWWSNAIFFIAFHIVGVSALYYRPLSWRTWFLCYINWQLGTLGITIGTFPFTLLTIGYHRLWSHRSFTARFPLRIVLAAMGTLGFQGSIRLEPSV